jgi:hypothetical protein
MIKNICTITLLIIFFKIQGYAEISYGYKNFLLGMNKENAIKNIKKDYNKDYTIDYNFIKEEIKNIILIRDNNDTKKNILLYFDYNNNLYQIIIDAGYMNADKYQALIENMKSKYKNPDNVNYDYSPGYPLVGWQFNERYLIICSYEADMEKTCISYKDKFLEKKNREKIYKLDEY